MQICGVLVAAAIVISKTVWFMWKQAEGEDLFKEIAFLL